ncbi:hypothetical protein BH24BAC1_BH24BAC1_13860 [soil metagenome]
MKSIFIRTLYAPALLVGALLLGGCEEVDCIKGQGEVESRTLELEPMKEVEVNGSFRVYLKQGAQQQVVVKGEPNVLNELRTNVAGDKWKIEFRRCIRRNKPVEVYLTLPQVTSLYLNGSGQLISENKLTAPNLALELNGSGVIELEVAANKLITKKTGSGEILLGGEAREHHLQMAGSGKVALYNLQSEDVRVKLAGSGTAEVSASQSLHVEIDGSGKVYYIGNPNLTQRISGSGKVIQR